MDTERAREVLTWWLTTSKTTGTSSFGSSSGRSETHYFPSKSSPVLAKLREREDQTRRVAAHVLGLKQLPELISDLTSSSVSLEAGMRTVEYALGRVNTDDETRAIIGSQAPAMSAEALHPLIWGAASKHWDVSHYGAAVQRAATMLNAEVQDRTQRTNASDADLMKQTFSLEAPQEGKPRLRWPGADDDLTVKAMRVGILNLSQGVFSAIRNPATHSTGDMERQEALEQLATLSILTRWIDRCELVSV